MSAVKLVDRLIEQLSARGLRIEPGDQPGQLRLVGKVTEADDAVMKALRLFKPQLLERFGAASRPEPVPEPEPEVFQARVTVEAPAVEAVTCELCGREVDAVDRGSLAGNPLLCEHYGNSERRNRDGVITQKHEPRCPWKESP